MISSDFSVFSRLFHCKSWIQLAQSFSRQYNLSFIFVCHLTDFLIFSCLFDKKTNLHLFTVVFMLNFKIFKILITSFDFFYFIFIFPRPSSPFPLELISVWSGKFCLIRVLRYSNKGARIKCDFIIWVLEKFNKFHRAHNTQLP